MARALHYVANIRRSQGRLIRRAGPVVAQAADGWPESSNREIVWRQRRRSRIDRHAEDPPPESLRGAGDKVMSGGAVTSGSKERGENPAGAETSGGERVAVSLNRRARDDESVVGSKP